MRRLFLLIQALAIVALAGCGDGLRRVPVKGTVTAKNGPVEGATVVFMPLDATTKGEGGIGTTEKDGAFTLTGSRRGDPGVVPGKYKVRVSRFMDRDGTILSAEAKQAEFPHARESIPVPYSSPTSPLEVTVPADGGPVSVEIPAKTLNKK